MKNKILTMVLAFLLVIAASAGMARVVFGTGSTDIPVAYVINDGADCYYIDFNDLLNSYMAYRIDPESDSARLAKFYFDKTGSDVMASFNAYVSGITGKFVSFGAVISKYIETRNVDDTYIWFNSFDATPAFSNITRVWVLDVGCNVSGRYYVDTNGYIIRRSSYTIETTAPSTAGANTSEEFSVTVTGNDLGCESFEGVLSCEITGGAYNFEYENSGVWEVCTGGQIGSAVTVTPEWNQTAAVRFTAYSGGIYTLTIRLKTSGGDLIAEKMLNIDVTDVMQISASVPIFRAGEPGQFTISTTAGADAGRMARAYFTMPSGVTAEYYDSTAGSWNLLPDVYGPLSGFPITDDTMVLRATFDEAGTKTMTVQYIEVGTGSLLAGKDIEMTAISPMTVSADLPDFYVNEAEQFTISTIANDDEGRMVRAHFTVSSDVLLEYQEEGTGIWLPLTDAYGPLSGFAVTNTTYTFRATFLSNGMKAITVKFIEAGTDIVLADKTFIATARYRVTQMISVPGFDSISISANTTDAYVNLANPVSNECLFKISIILEDGTVLYTSEMLAPGEKTENITLICMLSPGVYNAVVKYEAYDIDDLSQLNSAEVSVTITVK